MGADVLVITPRSASGLGELRETWRRRELLRILMLREFQVRYRQAVLGVLWALLQPGLMMVLFWLAFGKVAGIGSVAGVPYPLFALTGLVLWQICSGGVMHAANSLIENERLITKVYFPRLMLPLAAVGVALLDVAIALVVLAGSLLIAGLPIPSSVWLLLPAILLAAATALGVGLLLSALNVRFRDVRYVLPLFMQAWLMATPVAYPMELVPAGLRPWFELNPMAGAVALFRGAMLGTPVDGRTVAVAFAVGTLALCAGLWYFSRTERSFADRI